MLFQVKSRGRGRWGPLLETKISSTKVSRVCQRLDVQAANYHRRPLMDEYPYLILDAITLKVRYNGHYLHSALGYKSPSRFEHEFNNSGHMTQLANP